MNGNNSETDLKEKINFKLKNQKMLEISFSDCNQSPTKDCDRDDI